MKVVLKWLGRLATALVLILVVIFIIAAVAPPTVDEPVDLDNHGAGASNVIPSYTGLDRAFPEINTPADNPTNDAKVELGRLLFFDPVLSENNELSCASCHQPDKGFSDGRTVPLGMNGTSLTRNSPTLWNVGYAQNLFWDGRLESLEAQAEQPLTHPDEMGVIDTAALEKEIQAIAAYEALFIEAFNGEQVSLENIEKALAAFQRTLISNDSPFDRYAAGEFGALTAQQRRGLALFRSGATRCFECHTAPTFASDTFRVVGVDSPDPGRAAIVDDGLHGAFKVPTLRNIALTAPYMHDGSFETLEEVITFYSDGGGHAHDAENVDVFVNSFDLNDQELADMVSFLHALTDESKMPSIPQMVPSGLPVIERSENPMRELSASFNVGGPGRVIEDRGPITLTVAEGQTVQDVVDGAQTGDTVEIPYAIYNERVVLDLNGITIRGIPNDAGEYPIFDGENALSEAFLVSGNDFVISHLHIRNYTDNGVLVEGTTNVHFHDMVVEHPGAYGIYPVQCTNAIIERIVVSGADDAGIYAGQCENVIARENTVFGNVIGIELENTLGGEIYDNETNGNTVGILVVLLPQLTSRISRDTLVYNNVANDNNLTNFGRAGAVVSLLPPGIGILVLGSDHNEIYNNTMTGNKSSGIAVFGLTSTGTFDKNELDVGPLAEGNWVHDNTYANNGYDPDPFIKDLGIPVGDILWDGEGTGNRFDEEDAKAFPPILPSDSWPEFAQRAYSNILSFLLGYIA